MFIIIVLIIPIFANAATYEKAKYQANNFINNFSDMDRYLMVNDTLPYDYDWLEKDFKNGGLLSKKRI